MIKIIFVFAFFALSLNSLQIDKRIPGIFEIPGRPKTICSSLELKAFQSSQIISKGQFNTAGAIWSQNAFQLSNGFSATFQVSLSQPVCGSCGSSCSSTCPAEGFAFVIQTSGGQSLGLAGGGLGYANIYNAMAVEFDTKYNPEYNDPQPTSTGARHISAILKTGVADANEINAFLWNDDPVNFDRIKEEGFINNPVIKIEYLNQFLTVQVNGVLQAGYYYPINFAKEFNIQTPMFYFGLTASNGANAIDFNVSNFTMQVVAPDISLSQVSQKTKDPIKAGDYFEFFINLKDGCGNIYTENPAFESYKDVTMVKNDNCIMDKVFPGAVKNQESTYSVVFLCTKAGVQNLTLQFKNQTLGGKAVSVNILPASFDYATVNFYQGQYGTVDSMFKFKVIPQDIQGNVAETNYLYLSQMIQIAWPNPAESKKPFSVIYQTDGSYIFTVEAYSMGIYSVSSSLFVKVGGKYEFQILVGAPSSSMSSIKVNNTNLDLTKIVAGTQVSVISLLKDRVGNEITDDSLVSKVNITASDILFNKQGVLTTFVGSLTKSGSLTITGNYNSSFTLSCTNCLVKVIPGAPYYPKFTMNQFNAAKGLFEDVNGVYYLNKGDLFQYLLVQKDQYENLIETTNDDVTATLSGNYMTPINLCTAFQGIQIKITVCDKDLTDYYKLVGRKNYQITVTSKADSTKTMTFSLEIDSHGTDTGIGNGPYMVQRCQLYWIKGPTYRRAIAGQMYSMGIIITNVEGLRYNGFIPVSSISIVNNPTDNTEVLSTIRQGTEVGQYFADITYKSTAKPTRRLLLNVDGKTSSSIQSLNIIPAAATKYTLGGDLVSINNRIVNVGDQISFTVQTTDDFNNPSDMKSMDFNAVKTGDSTVSVSLECQWINLGSYSCLGTAKTPGTFNIQSYIISGTEAFTINRLAPLATNCKVSTESQSLTAGDLISLVVTVLDSDGSVYPNESIVKYISSFSGKLQLKSSSQVIDLPFNTSDSIGNGVIKKKIPTDIATIYSLQVYIQNVLVACTTCSVNVVPGPVDFTKTKYTMTKANTQQNLDIKSLLSIANKDENPVINAFLFDKFTNAITLSDDITKGITFNTQLSGTKIKTSYTLNQASLPTNYIFSIADTDVKNFSEELYNENCGITFNFNQANIPASASISKVILQGGGKDADLPFTTNPPTAAGIRVNPFDITFEAGKSATFSIELRDDSGKLFTHPSTGGWYSNPQSSFKFSFGSVTVVNGKQKGTYIGSITSTKAGKQAVKVSYQNPSGTDFIDATQNLGITVTPSIIAKAKITDDSMTVCKAGINTEIPFKAFDQYDNEITIFTIESLKLDVKYTDTKKIFEFSSNDIKKSLQFTCKYAGSVSLTSSNILLSSASTQTVINSYNFKIVAGDVSPSNSNAFLDKTTGIAPQILVWTIVLQDSFNNPIAWTTDITSKLKSSFTFSTVSDDGVSTPTSTSFSTPSAQTQNNLTVASKYEFSTLYNNQKIPSTSFTAIINPGIADQLNSKVRLWNDQSQQYDIYKDLFIVDKSSNPKFKVFLKDSQGNPTSDLPLTWKIQSVVTNSELLVSGELAMCVDGLEIKLCQDSTSLKKWNSLVIANSYVLKTGISNFTVILDNNNLQINGAKDDPQVSNLPVEPLNCLLLPAGPIVGKAGQNINLVVDIRTTNKNLRPNDWFDSPADSISLMFSRDISLKNFSIKRGTKRGLYEISFYSELAVYPENLVSVSLSVNKTKVPSQDKTLQIDPEAPFTFANLTAIESITADNSYFNEFVVKDKFGNQVFAKSVGADWVSVVDSKSTRKDFQAVINSKSNLELKILPKAVSTYALTIVNSTFSFKVTPGAISLATSFGQIRTQNNYIAGNKLQVEFNGFDQYMNEAPVNNIALIMREKATSATISTFSVDSQKPNNCVFEFGMTKKGINTFSLEFSGSVVTMKSSTVNVLPGPISFLKSVLYEIKAGSSQPTLAASPLRENNAAELPNLLLQTYDDFLNELDSVSADVTSKMQIVLFGNEVTQDKGVAFTPIGSSSANKITLSIANNDGMTLYKKMLYRATPYNLNMSYSPSTTPQSLSQPVILEGTGAADVEAQIIQPANISKTYFSTDTLSIVAGAFGSFYLEIRTNDGLRKADAYSIDLKVSPQDASVPLQFKYNVGDLNGRFFVHLSSTKAGSFKILFNINGTNTSNNFTLNVSPAKVSTAELLYNSSFVGSADEKYIVRAQGKDVYGNAALVSQEELQVSFIASYTDYKNSGGSMTANVDFISAAEENNFKLRFEINSIYAGDYKAKSALFSSDYKFKVKAGVFSKITSSMKISPVSVIAGNNISATLTLFDKNFNKLCTDNLDEKVVTVVAGSTSLLRGSDWAFSQALTIAGTFFVSAKVSGVEVSCQTCSFVVLPGPVALQKTQFQQNNYFSEVRTIDVNYGVEGFSLLGKLYDSFGNLINTPFATGTSLAASISGNNMTTLTMSSSFDSKSTLFTLAVQDSDKKYFSYVVPSNLYKIDLTYVEATKTQTLQLGLNILGLEDGYGNGELDLTKTFVQIPLLNLIAGDDNSIQVELRTTENKRYNRPVDITIIKPTQETDAKSTSEKLVLNIDKGAKNGLFLMRANGKQAIGVNQNNKTIFAVYNGTNLPRIAVQIFPANPDVKKTTLVQKLPDVINANNTYSVKFSLFDSFGNSYVDAKYCQNLTVKVSQGGATFSSVFVNSDNVYEVTVSKAQYPPKTLNFNLFFVKSKDQMLALFNTEFSAVIDTSVDLNATDVLGSALAGVAPESAFSLSILLKNNFGYCYDKPAIVKMNINAQNVNLDLNAVTVTSSTAQSSCNQYYSVNVPAKSFTKVGNYTIKVNVDGTNVAKSFSPIVIIPGEVDITKSVLSLGGNNNVFTAGIDFSINIALFDTNSNSLQKPVNDLSVTIDGMDSSLWNSKISSPKSDGNMVLTLNIKKAGIVDKIRLQRGNASVLFGQLQKIDVSTPLLINPQLCSTDFPNIQNVPPTVYIGKEYSFILNCKDKFNNEGALSTYNFVVDISGTNLPTVGIDNPLATITPKATASNSYKVAFKVAWEGSYTIKVFFNGIVYGEIKSFTAVKNICPPENPVMCLKTNTCVKGYRSCDYDSFKFCVSETSPVSCLVNGQSTCVKSSYLCDCPTGKVKCKNSFKCATNNDECTIATERQSCPGTLQLCPDKFSCRLNLVDCPSPMACPPGFNLCADLSCIEETKSCLTKTSCPQTTPFRCPDARCVASFSECQTLMTCSNQNNLVCPDSTCAANELACRQPRICNDGEFKCWDQSCVVDLTLCPKGITCPLGQALCEDKICRDTCQSLKPATSRRLLGTNIATVSVQNECKANETKCPSGECVPEYFICPSSSSVPEGLVVCPDGSFSSSIRDCVQNVCPKNYFHCPEGKCVLDKKNCGTSVSCPDEFPHLCADGACASSASSCASESSCPENEPLRCGSGVCRASAAECPTTITCPAEMPVKCSDGSCKKAKYHCKAIVEASKCPAELVRCPGGSCAYSKDLCPTVASCRKNEVRCWDGSCQSDLSQCDVPLQDTRICPSNLPVRCPSGSCSATILDCPTDIICPRSMPILCDDGNCRQSLEQCSSNSFCGAGFKRCPDGSCSLHVCGTPITCPTQAPYKCQDNTCKSDPRDCKLPKVCPDDSPIMCPDMTCVSQRINCKGYSLCPSDKPVRCPDENCYKSVKDCMPIDGCPPSKVKCGDGSCAVQASLCPKLSCPKNLNFLCDDGTCTDNKMFCNLDNGCPYSAPNKCKDGRCVVDANKCPKNVTCPTGLVLCPDGSCSNKIANCPLQNGCAKETPVRCANGDCNPLNIQCPISNCPKETPIKCDSGLCVQTYSACSKIVFANNNQCTSGISRIPCGDGSCVLESSMCKPLYQCDMNSFRCGDGSCKRAISLCPLVNSTCPDSSPFRCKTGICVTSADDCPNPNNGCPIKAPVKCFRTGGCAKNESICTSLYSQKLLPNGCTYEKPVLCDDGKCVEKPLRCKSKVDCSAIQCEDGSCAATVKECLSKPLGCKPNEFECPDLTCVSSREKCQTSDDCPLEKPFKCFNGGCVDSSDKCSVKISCPNEAPFLCTTGACVPDYSMCSADEGCPEEKPFRCPGSICVDSKSSCPSLDKCPDSMPVKCSDGQCRQNTFDCMRNQLAFCPSERSFYCKFDLCTKSLAECHSNIEVGKTRILESTNSTCGYVCSDGSCAISKEKCPVIQGCFDPASPIRCPDGSCGSTCTTSASKCGANLTLCEDGTCRSDCPFFMGCPMSSPYQCPNGYCAKDIASCAGDSSCPILTPFRCPDNSCVEKTSQCIFSSKFLITQPFQVTSSDVQIQSQSFLQLPGSSVKYGKMFLPPGVINQDEKTEKRMLASSTNEVFIFNGLPMSKYLDYNVIPDISTKAYVQKFFPLYETALNYHEGIRSSIIEIQTTSNYTGYFGMPIALYLKIDYITGTQPTDYCLSSPIDQAKSWVCSWRALAEMVDGFIVFLVFKQGAYTVTFSPDKMPAPSNIVTCDWYCENKLLLLVIPPVALIALFLLSYGFWRIYRYVDKYRQGKKDLENNKNYMQELERKDFSKQGETAKDQNRGLNFESNDRALEEANRDKRQIDQLNFELKSAEDKNRFLEHQANDMREKNSLLENEIEALKKEIENVRMMHGEQGYIEDVEKEVQELE